MCSCFLTEGIYQLIQNFIYFLSYQLFHLQLNLHDSCQLLCLLNKHIYGSIYFYLFYANSYGASDGYPSQLGITKDAQVCLLANNINLHLLLSLQKFFDYVMRSCCQAALDHLSQRSDIDTSRIVVFGRSLGGAVGAAVTRNNPDKVCFQ